jgi:N-acetylmuramic acid 6-phosphate (MurNAc-6-P) etherase
MVCDARTVRSFASICMITFPTNHKRHQRTTTLLQRRAGVDRQTATTLLYAAGGETHTAIVMSLLHVTASVARQRLSTQKDRLRETLAALDR